jgi:hypothetical protein
MTAIVVGPSEARGQAALLIVLVVVGLDRLLTPG